MAAVSAAAYGGIVNTSEFDDMEALGAAFDAATTDEEIIAMTTQAMGADSPYVSQSMGMAIEIPLGRPQGAKGRIVAVFTTAPNPGRFQASVAFAGQVSEVMERHGGRNCRLWQAQANGVLPDVCYFVTEWDTMKAYGKSVGSMYTDPALQSLMEMMQGSDSPFRNISADMYTEIGG